MATILIVDDEKSIRITLGEFLRDAGHVVETAEDAGQAEEVLGRMEFDIVVTDIVLPRVSGVELLHRIRRRAPGALVLLMTGEPTVETAVESVRGGAYDYLTKPITKDLILRAVERAAQYRSLLVERDRLERANRDYQEELERRVQERTRALRETEGLYQSLVENLPMNILRKDRQGRFTFANQRFCETLGRPLGAILTRTDADFFPAELAAKYREDDERVMDSGQAQELVERHLMPDGQERFVQANKTPLCNLEGAVTGIQCIFTDITERKRVEDQMRKLARAVDQSPATIVITDRLGRIEFANPRFTQTSGYRLEEVLGQNPRFMKSGETTADEYRQMWETITAGGTWTGEFHNRRKDGGLFWESASISPLRDAAGEITHFIAIKMDISEFKQLESKFLRAQRLGSIGALASGIAHDLNNTLAPVLICVPMLRGDLGRPERSQLLSTIESSVDRAVGIVRQLLSLGHARDGKPIPLQAEHLVREMGKIIRETFPRSIQLSLSCGAGVWPVLGNATQIHQILMNLCVNARDAMPEGGRLSMRVENLVADEVFLAAHPEGHPGRYVRLQVADTGCGIPEEARARIFDAFFTTKAPEKGTGLGLTTVLGIVKSHQGFLTFTSETGRGTAFDVFLPAVADAVVGRAREAAVAPPPGGGETVLVVDDEPAIRQTLQRSLERHGYRVVVAVDGEEALARLATAEAAIRLVITDLMMPGMDGLALCRRLRAVDSRLPILISTGALLGESGASTAATLQAMGITRLLLKPYDSLTLLREVAEAMRAPGTNVA